MSHGGILGALNDCDGWDEVIGFRGGIYQAQGS